MFNGFDSILADTDMIKELEKKFKALGDLSRLRILNMLVVKPMCVCEIREIMGLSQSTVSGHLKVLTDAELIKSRKDKLWVEYSLSLDNAETEKILNFAAKYFKSDNSFLNDRKKAVKIDRAIVCNR